MAEQASAASDVGSQPPDSQAGVPRSVARALGRAARWAVDEAETLTGSAKQVIAAGGRVTTWVTGTGHEEAVDTHELLQQLKALLADKPSEELESLAHDPKLWTLLGRLQKSQRRWPWARGKARAEAADTKGDGGLLSADNGEDASSGSAEETPGTAPEGQPGSDAAQAESPPAESPPLADAGVAGQAEEGPEEAAEADGESPDDDDAPKGKKGKK